MVRWAAAIVCLLGAGCDPLSFGSSPPPDAHPVGPSASVPLPPLFTAPPSDAGARRSRDAGDAGLAKGDAAPPPPEPFEGDEVFDPEVPRSPEVAGISLTAVWRQRDVPDRPQLPHLNAKALDELAGLASGRLMVWLGTHGRMRVEIASRALPLPEGSGVLGQFERYGHLLVWPDGRRYRVLVPGVLRSVLGELRADVSPLSRGRIERKGAGERLGLKTRKLAVSSAYGVVELEVAPMVEAGLGAPLWCRLVVEIAGVDPSTEACREGEVALAAQLSWKRGEDEVGPGFSLEVTDIGRHGDLPSERFSMPPPAAVPTASGLPQPASTHFFSEPELSALRTEAAAEPEPPDPKAPERGLIAENRSDVPMVLMLDGVPVASVAAWGQLPILGPPNGRYSVQWRTFLGELVEEPAERDLPARIVFGEQPEQPDAPDGG